MNFQIHAHIQKLKAEPGPVGYTQQLLFPRDFLQVSEDVDVRENIHHLQSLGCGGREKSQWSTHKDTHLTAGCQDFGPPSRSCQKYPTTPYPSFLLLMQYQFPLSLGLFSICKMLRP